MSKTSENPFSEVMKRRTDEDLVDIVTVSRDDYKPEALAAAENEMCQRQLDPAFIQKAHDIALEDRLLTQKKETEPLEGIFRWTLFFLPWLASSLAFLFLLRDGRDQKYRDAWRWTFYGTGFYIILITALTLLGA